MWKSGKLRKEMMINTLFNMNISFMETKKEGYIALIGMKETAVGTTF